jgi:geranylgeranylglycerol-phosphate geranylgeranyltransferase
MAPLGDAALEVRQALGVLRTAGALPRRSAAPAAYVRLIRPGDTSFAVIGTLLGAGLAGLDRSWLAAAIWISVSNGALSAASMAFNDWHDVEEDRINRPTRPIPAGAIRPHAACVLAAFLFLVAVAIAAMVGLSFAAAAAIIAIASVAYTVRVKSLPLAGNLLTASMSSYPLWCWAAVARHPSNLLIGAAAGFLLGSVGREIVRTAGDRHGDEACGIRTVATACGSRAANRFGLALILAGLGVAQIAVWQDDSVGYRLALVVSTAAFMVSAYRLRRRTPADTSAHLTRLARHATALLATGVAWDLFRAGWPLS